MQVAPESSCTHSSCAALTEQAHIDEARRPSSKVAGEVARKGFWIAEGVDELVALPHQCGETNHRRDCLPAARMML